MLYARYRGAHPAAVWGAIVALLGGAALVAWMRGRRRFESVATARVRLEDALGLKARLSAAASGVGAWPDPPAGGSIDWPVRWQVRRPLGWAVGVATLLACASLVPVSEPQSARGRVLIEKPADVRVVEQWLDAVRREQAVDERSVEEARDRIAQLLERPADEWYEHASLEAAGTLREQTAADLGEMLENLARAERTAASLREATEATPRELREALARDLQDAAITLDTAAFRPPPDLAELLRGPGDGDLTPAECRDWCEALAERLAENRADLLRALGDALGIGDDERSLMVENADAMIADEAGIQRGRADAELTRGEQHDLGTTRKERVGQPFDPERAAPAELLAVIDGEHEIDETAYTGPQAGGTAKEGDGGSSARIDGLLPAEQDVVRRFFR